MFGFMFLIFTLMDIKTELRRRNNLLEKQNEILKEQNQILKK
jgi:hypothetical protein